MRILLDSNIIIHRETINPQNKDIGKLFSWIDKLGYKKYIHQVSRDEILNNRDGKIQAALSIKLDSYQLLPFQSCLSKEINDISSKMDSSENDRIDNILLNEIFLKNVDLLITEDRKIHHKARLLGMEERVFTIDQFLENVVRENPELIEYRSLSIRKDYFGNIDIDDDFFDSLKNDYFGFEGWFKKKSDQVAYISKSDENKIVAFLYMKKETEDENYNDIDPIFEKGKRLKVGTFKVSKYGFKIGERFIKIIFDNALNMNVDEIYLTIFNRTLEQNRLIELIQEFGFIYWGKKTSRSGVEDVYVRKFDPKINNDDPVKSYPYISNRSDKYIVSIRPEYHTNLFPDSILNNESPMDFIEQEPYRNSINKSFISRSYFRNLKKGDIIVFYRTGGYYQGVISTIGIVQDVKINIRTFEELKNITKKRTVLTEDELRGFWNDYNRPFVVHFLYVYSFPKRLNMKRLIELGVIKDISSAPRGFEKLSDEQFNTIMKETGSNEDIVVD